MRRICLPVALFLAALALASCSAQKKAITDSPNPKLAAATFRIGGAQLSAEIAKTDVERERGLMFRTSLPEGTGMLFVFDQDEQLSFWMKNTKLPLSIAFIASDGTVRQIEDMVPESLATTQAERSCRYALEVPKGWFGRAEVRVGDKLDLGPLQGAD
jgi:uncharacterized protein